MRSLLLIAVLVATAQAEPASDPPPAAAPVAEAAPAPVHPKLPRAESPTELAGRKAQALGIARQFMTGLLEENPRLTVARSSFPFLLETQRIDTPEQLLPALIRQLHGRRVDLLTLYGIEVLTPAEMIQKYGKPPDRLATFPRASQLFYAVANVSGHAAVLAMKEVDEGQWAVAAYTD
jgi:hypothetical protein